MRRNTYKEDEILEEPFDIIVYNKNVIIFDNLHAEKLGEISEKYVESIEFPKNIDSNNYDIAYYKLLSKIIKYGDSSPFKKPNDISDFKRLLIALGFYNSNGTEYIAQILQYCHNNNLKFVKLTDMYEMLSHSNKADITSEQIKYSCNNVFKEFRNTYYPILQLKFKFSTESLSKFVKSMNEYEWK